MSSAQVSVSPIPTTAGPQIMFHCNVDGEKKPKNNIPDQGHRPCGVCTFFPCLCGFSPETPVSSLIPKMFMWGAGAWLHDRGLRECGRVCQWPWDARASCPGWVCACLVAWAARIGSRHSGPWIGIRGGKQSFILLVFYSSFKNVCIAHIYLMFNMRSVFSLYLEVGDVYVTGNVP